MTEIVKNPLTREECIKWIEALRSGEYVQGQSHLVNHDGSRCCLGVLKGVCRLDDIPEEEGELKLGINVYKLPQETQKELWRLNDRKMRSFSFIAEYIEDRILPTLES
jgi:hypothetical protein